MGLLHCENLVQLLHLATGVQYLAPSPESGYVSLFHLQALWSGVESVFSCMPGIWGPFGCAFMSWVHVWGPCAALALGSGVRNLVSGIQGPLSTFEFGAQGLRSSLALKSGVYQPMVIVSNSTPIGVSTLGHSEEGNCIQCK